MIEPTPASTDARYLPEARWTPRHFGLLFVGWLVGAVVGGILATTFGYGADPIGVFGFILGGQALGTLGTAEYLSRSRGTGSWRRDFGMELRWRDAWGIPAGAFLQIGAALFTALVLSAFDVADPPIQEVVEIAADAKTSGTVIIALFGAAVLAPLLEEVMYRGVLLSWLASRSRKHLAVLASAAIFASVHLVDPNVVFQLPGLFVIGVALGYAAFRSMSLSLPLFLHAGVNLTGVLLTLYGQEILDWAERIEENAGLIVPFL